TRPSPPSRSSRPREPPAAPFRGRALRGDGPPSLLGRGLAHSRGRRHGHHRAHVPPPGARAHHVGAALRLSPGGMAGRALRGGTGSAGGGPAPLLLPAGP